MTRENFMENFMENHEARIKEMEKRIREIKEEEETVILETKNTKIINELNDLLDQL